MKQSELTNADADFQRRFKELKIAEASSDLHTELVVLGTIMVEKIES